LPPSTRRLVAIMFTDIAGYTTLMGEDEDRAVEALARCRSIIRPQVEKHVSRVHPGDRRLPE
jgi:class 3 adenylate cyclase